MSLHQRGGVWHFDFAVRGERYRGSTFCKLKTDAKFVEARERRRAERGEAPGQQALSLAMAFDQWFTARIADKKSADDYAERSLIAMRLLGRDTPITTIGAPEINAAMQARRLEKTRHGRPPANATVNRDLIDMTLRPLLYYCEKVLELPVRRVEWKQLRLAEPKGRSPSFSPDQLAAWRAALPPWHQPVFDFFVCYGVRLGEVFFTLDDLDLDAGRVTLRDRKDGGDHPLDLLPDDVAAFAARIGRARAAGIDSPWFRQMKDGSLRPIRYRGFEAASTRALTLAGVVARPVHDLRHHAASEINRTGGLKAAQDILGHRSIISTQRYAHTTREDRLKALGHTFTHTADEAPEKTKGNKAHG